MRVILELNAGVHPLSGTVPRGPGDRVDFTGTLELLALLETTVTNRSPCRGNARTGQRWRKNRQRLHNRAGIGFAVVRAAAAPPRPARRKILKAATDMVSSAKNQNPLHPTRAPKGLVVGGIVTIVALLAVGACGRSPAAGPARSSQPPSTVASRGAIAVTYDAHGHSSEGPDRFHAVLVASGPRHVRLEVRATEFGHLLFVYDGHRLLLHDPEESQPWSLYQAPGEHPDQFELVAGMFSDPSSAVFARGCPSARVVGHKRILGRDAVGYHCAAHYLADGSGMGAYTTWIDQKTGVLLRSGPFRALVFDEHPRITASTFSTQPPQGTKVVVYPAQKRPGGLLTKAPHFELKRVGSSPSTISLADYAGRPVVLAFFSSDIAFGGDICPGCVDSLLTLQRLKMSGTRPTVLAVQVGEEGKPGYPLIPKGLHLEVVNDPNAEVQHSYGLSELIGFAFVGSDGMVHQVFNKKPTNQQLKIAFDALR